MALDLLGAQRLQHPVRYARIVVVGQQIALTAEQRGLPAIAVGELHRVLRPEAVLVLSVPLNPKLWDDADVWAGHVKRYEKQELVELLEGHGFAVDDVRTWGFPLGRIYHRLLFGPWVRRTAQVDGAECSERLDTKAASHRKLVETVAGLLRFDELFAGTALGRGIIVAARRR